MTRAGRAVAIAVTLWAVALAAVPALAGRSGSASPYRVEIATDPSVVPVGKARLLIRVTDRTGAPATGAQVRALAQMPGMPMGEQEATATEDPARPASTRFP